MEKNNTNRKYKNSVFTTLFGEKKNLLEMYSAVSGKEYPEDTEVRIITLSNILFMEQQNDIAFVIDGKLVVLIEHQSTINENMPLRMLIYMAREYEQLTSSSDLYRQKRIGIPTPEFIVLYNGKQEYPDYKEMRLSDSFMMKNEVCFLELVVKVYNINKGRNADMVSRCSSLSGYSELVAEVEENKKSMGLAAAVKTAVKSCMSRNILVYFLKEHSAEVENMLLGEWNLKDALVIAREEAKEEALKEGIEIGDAKLQKLIALWENGTSLDEAKRQLNLQ
ncbi:MAG: Rpn family recombination-promoting nuclease/putative transposase [Fibromonadales bacterium]|nr:Rpn family recombination-promoting nuclease/putative transposase [Fibromonadales bacterium]